MCNHFAHVGHLNISWIMASGLIIAIVEYFQFDCETTNLQPVEGKEWIDCETLVTIRICVKRRQGYYLINAAGNTIPKPGESTSLTDIPAVDAPISLPFLPERWDDAPPHYDAPLLEGTTMDDLTLRLGAPRNPSITLACSVLSS